MTIDELTTALQRFATDKSFLTCSLAIETGDGLVDIDQIEQVERYNQEDKTWEKFVLLRSFSLCSP